MEPKWPLKYIQTAIKDEYDYSLSKEDLEHMLHICLINGDSDMMVVVVVVLVRSFVRPFVR